MDNLIEKNQPCALMRIDRCLYFKQMGKGGHTWVGLQDADILPHRRWLVADGEKVVPVRVTKQISLLDSSPPLSGGSVEAAQQPENKENAREWILCASSDQRPGNMLSVYNGPDLDEDEIVTVREVRPALRLPSYPVGPTDKKEGEA